MNKNFDVLGFSINARNKTEARQIAEKRVIALANADFLPVMVQGNQYTAVVFRDLYSYSYMVFSKLDGIAILTKGALNCGFSDDSRSYVMFQAVTDIAQREWTLAQGDDFSAWKMPDGTPLHASVLTNLQEWARWQLGYAYATKIVKETDNTAHRSASDYFRRLGTSFILDSLRGGGHL